MAETIYTYALTTVARLKARLGITVSTHDANFLRYANALTDFIEMHCNRRFKSTTYTSEVYSARAHNARYVLLKQAPVTSLSVLQYSNGTPSAKGWTSYGADDYELCEDGKTGLVRVYGAIPYGTNKIRATYVAGYLIDFANAGTATHTLPADLTDVAERMIAKVFKRRENEGKESESFDGGNVVWEKYLSDDDKVILAKYKRVPQFY